MDITYGGTSLFVAILCVVSIAAIGEAGAVDGSTAAPNGTASTPETDDNETLHHENPDEYGEECDLEAMEA